MRASEAERDAVAAELREHAAAAHSEPKPDKPKRRSENVDADTEI